jgi:Rieske 2Fe-2S family protein
MSRYRGTGIQEPRVQPSELSRLIARQRPGWTLEQPFYTAASIYEVERRGWLATQWYLVGHRSELTDPGCHIVREILGESLIIVRDEAGAVRAFYNVCRHRGSRLCAADGRAARLVCPYHAWAYGLDGGLRAAAAMPPDTDLHALGLRSVPAREIEGLVFVSLAGRADALDAVQGGVGPLLQYHGIPGARIAARRSYPTAANWKLVIENFMECYHCLPAHPEYSSVMQHIDVVGRVAPAAAAERARQVEEWFRTAADPESPLGPAQLQPGRDDTAFRLFREPIGGGRRTQSQDGQPVAPLMGRQRRFDGGNAGFSLRPFAACVALNDHAVLFQFMPSGPERTEVVLTWLVDGAASDAAVDVDRMCWLWDVTTRQDKTIIEQNAAGVRSQAYTPGPYSLLESWPARFVSRYLQELADSIGAEPSG